MKNLTWIVVLLITQAISIGFTFDKLVKNPGDYALSNEGDGIKNYFTLYAYVNDTTEMPYSRFRMMNYPFREIVFYTDNTPLFAVPYKFLSQSFPSLRNKVIAVFNFLLLFNILLCTALLFWIFRRLAAPALIAFIFSLSLPWINPMFMRLTGHFNLSLSSVIVFWICMLIKIYDSRQKNGPLVLYSLLLALTLTTSFFIHPYFTFIGMLMSGFFLFVLGITERSKIFIGASLAIPAGAILLNALFLFLLDPYRSLRSDAVLGLGFDDWEVTLASIFTPYSFNTIRVLGSSNIYPFHFEARAYIGAAAVVALLLIFLSFFYRRQSRAFWEQVHLSQQFKLVFLLFLTMLFMIMLSFGEDFYILKTKHHFYNFLNPIYILRRTVLPELAHIRYVSRFYFPVLFILYICLIFLLDILRKTNRRTFRITAGIILLLLLIDMFDAFRAQPRVVPNPFSKAQLSHIEGSEFGLNDFDAVLSIPYYHVGSSETRYTLEKDEGFFNYTLQFSAKTDLPLMSSKMSRTPEYQCTQLIGIFLNKGPDESIRTLLRGKNILVICDKNLNRKYAGLVSDSDNIESRVQKNGVTLPVELGMTKLQESENYIFYKWTVL